MDVLASSEGGFFSAHSHIRTRRAVKRFCKNYNVSYNSRDLFFFSICLILFSFLSVSFELFCNYSSILCTLHYLELCSYYVGADLVLTSSLIDIWILACKDSALQCSSCYSSNFQYGVCVLEQSASLNNVNKTVFCSESYRCAI